MFLTSVADLIRRQAREAFARRIGFLHASGYAVGSQSARTPRRAAQRLRRRQAKLEVLRAYEHNPAGSKLLRRAFKAKHGHRGDYAEAHAWYTQYHPCIKEGA